MKAKSTKINGENGGFRLVNFQDLREIFPKSTQYRLMIQLQ